MKIINSLVFVLCILSSCNLINRHNVESTFREDIGFDNDSITVLSGDFQSGQLIYNMNFSERRQIFERYSFYDLDSLKCLMRAENCNVKTSINLKNDYRYNFKSDKAMYSFHIIGISPDSCSLVYFIFYGD